MEYLQLKRDLHTQYERCRPAVVITARCEPMRTFHHLPAVSFDPLERRQAGYGALGYEIL